MLSLTLFSKIPKICKGSHQDVYVSRPTEDLPAWVSAGDVLVGSLVLDKEKEGVTSMELLYIVPPKSNSTDAKKAEPTPKEKDNSLEDMVFKAKLDFMSEIRMKNATLYREHATKLKEERPSSVPLLLEFLSFALESPMPSTETNEDEWRAKEVELIYDAMKKENGGPVDQMILAQYFGLKEPESDELEEDKETKKRDKEMKEQRTALKKTLLARAVISGKIADKEGLAKDKFDEVVKDLKKWVIVDDLDDDKQKLEFLVTMAKHARICQDKKATALSILLKAKKDHSGKDVRQVIEELVKVYELYDGMDHLIANLNEEIHCRFPVAKHGV